MQRIGIDSLKEIMNVEILRNQQYWKSATLHRAVWMRKQRWELSLLEERRGTCSHWKVGQLPGHTTLKPKGKCPAPPVPPSNLLPAPPIGRAHEKVLGGAVHRHPHPRTERSHKDGEWVRGQPANQQFHFSGTSLQNRCTLGTRCIQKDMHEDVLFSTVYISKTSCSLGRKLCLSEEERATSFNVNGSQRQPYSISVISESS